MEEIVVAHEKACKVGHHYFKYRRTKYFITLISQILFFGSALLRGSSLARHMKKGLFVGRFAKGFATWTRYSNGSK